MPKLAAVAVLFALLCLPSAGRAEADEESRVLWDEVVTRMTESLRAIRSIELEYDHGHLTPGPVVLTEAQIAELPDIEGFDKAALAASLADGPPAEWQERHTKVAAEVDLLRDAWHNTRRARWMTGGDGLDRPLDELFDGKDLWSRIEPQWITVHENERDRKGPGSTPHDEAGFSSLVDLPGHPNSTGLLSLVSARAVDADTVEAHFRGDGPAGAYEVRYTFDRRYGCLPTSGASAFTGDEPHQRTTTEYLTVGEGEDAVHYPRRVVSEDRRPDEEELRVRFTSEVVPGTLRINPAFDDARFTLDVGPTDTVYVPTDNSFRQRPPSVCPAAQGQ